jgi:hypothetical protein
MQAGVPTGIAGLMWLGAPIIWLVYKDGSPRGRFRALQAFLLDVVRCPFIADRIDGGARRVF